MGEMSARGWKPATLGEAAGVDYGTVGDFLNGRRWPKSGECRSRPSSSTATTSCWRRSAGEFERVGAMRSLSQTRRGHGLTSRGRVR